MESYQAFAYVYDQLMSDVDYEKWANYIEEIFIHHKKEPKYIAELACGTGNITNRLAQKGYHIIGIDKSADMLAVAQDKASSMGLEIIYINHEMEDLILPTELDAVLCICDGFNYITEEKKLIDIFKMVNKHLSNEGIFVFDISSYHKLSNVLGNNTFAENQKNISFIWENYFDAKRHISEMDLTLFIKEGRFYRKSVEHHVQRAYHKDEILTFLEKANFKNKDTYKGFTLLAPEENSERICFVCKK